MIPESITNLIDLNLSIANNPTLSQYRLYQSIVDKVEVNEDTEITGLYLMDWNKTYWRWDPMFLKEKTRAVSYVRVSTKEQADEGYSIGAQKSQIMAYCKNKGYQLVGGSADEGISGKGMDNRYGLLDMLEDSRNDEFDVVVIWKLSRLSRKLVDTLSIIEELNDNNVSLESVFEKTDFSSTSGIFMTQVMASTNELERNVIAENVAMGHKAKAQQGSWNGNKVYGYNNIKGKNRKTTLSVHPEKAKVVQLFYAGSGLRAIANDLNNKGYTTKRGNPFSSVSIRDILDNRLYRGDIVYGRKAKNIKELHHRQGAA